MKPKGIKTTSGCELESNNGQVLVRLVRTVVYQGIAEQDFYTAHFFVKEGNSWVATETAHSYRTVEDFVKAISESGHFSVALAELKEV